MNLGSTFSPTATATAMTWQWRGEGLWLRWWLQLSLLLQWPSQWYGRNFGQRFMSPPYGQFSYKSAPNPPPKIALEVDSELPLCKRHKINYLAARKGQSPDADHLFLSGDVCLLSFDLEHGGEYCWMVQLSAQLIHMRIQEATIQMDLPLQINWRVWSFTQQDSMSISTQESLLFGRINAQTLMASGPQMMVMIWLISWSVYKA